MSNLFTCAEPKDFWVWVNPQNWLVRHQIQVVGSFFSGGLLPAQGKSNLMFIPNPDFEGDVTPFQHGVMREYMAEYNLEMGRVFHKGASINPSQFSQSRKVHCIKIAEIL
jgi:hypothetical protein